MSKHTKPASRIIIAEGAENKSPEPQNHQTGYKQSENKTIYQAKLPCLQ